MSTADSAAVWTTCLVFFQTALLAGYAYSDLIVRRMTPRSGVRLHLAVLLVSEQDPQVLSRQTRALEAAGAIVTPANATAARLVGEIVKLEG